jgi:two-component system, NtrC family, sensor kinase
MNFRQLKCRLSFQAKILVPVILLLVLLPAITLCILNRSSKAHLVKEARQQLRAADTFFRNSLEMRSRQLLARYKNVILNDSRFKAVAFLGDAATLNNDLQDRLDELTDDTEVILFVNPKGETLARVQRNGRFRLLEFERAAAPPIRQALSGQSSSLIAPVESSVFNVVALPVVINQTFTGALVIGVRVDLNTVKELTSLIRGEGVFTANRNVAASTLHNSDLHAASLPHWRNATNNAEPLIEAILLDGIHYHALASRFPAAPADADAGYVLLTSYEDSLQQLRRTQATLWLLSFLGVTISTIVIWVVIRKITSPLRELRNAAEAVGKGDFTPKVQVEVNDEFGQLGQAFNHMTRNLRTSHAELQKTVETLKATQAQLIQSEKLSAVGEFVGGVAHELNNPLTSVIGFAELLKEANLHPKHQSYLHYIVKSTERCHKIVQGLLSFARQHPPERRLVNVNEMVEGVLDILAYELRTSNIEVQREFQKDLPRLMGDSHQLQQVVLNILNNARQAIEAHQPSGRVRLTTESSAEMIRLIIDDNGPGIPKQTLPKIFDPFFTTKPVGKGTGLGLSLCYGIIHEHGGTITAHSESGKGASFIIELPIQKELAVADSDTASTGTLAQGAGKRVLVIDDEEWILELVRQILKQDGFEVDTAINGDAALQHVSRNRYELLVCDWKMPGLSGTQLYDRITSISPEAARRMIFMTGDVVNDTFQQFLKRHSKNCLSKPFSIQEFRQSINLVIAQRN